MNVTITSGEIIHLRTVPSMVSILMHLDGSDVGSLLINVSCSFWTFKSFCLCAWACTWTLDKRPALSSLSLCFWYPIACVYLFDETEETPADKWISASPLYTSLGNTEAGCKAGRFRDGSHHLPGCSRMREQSCGQSQDSVISHLSQLWEEKGLNKYSLKPGVWNTGFPACKPVTTLMVLT